MKKYRSIKRYVYIGTIIVICMLATSITAGKKEEKKPEKEVVSGKAVVVEDIKKEEPQKETSSIEKEEKKPEKKEFIPQYPTGGEIIKEFSDGKLVYSETLKDYRVHNGVDIKAEILAKVTASEAGVVEQVKNDPLMGITIVIDHQNGVKTVYSNLSSMDMVKEGDQVKKGQVINGVGDTSLIETGQEPHIHFEMMIDGICVDPQDYIV